MLSHYQRAHKNPIRCKASACVDSFENTDDMLKHWAKCHRHRGFSCFHTLCNSQFKTLPEAMKHSKEPHFRCVVKECTMVFQSKQAMVTHLLKKHFCCGVCKDKGEQRWVFRDRWEVEEHFRSVVGGHYYCWLCTELFLDRRQFEKHHEMKHRNGSSEVMEEVE